MIAIMDKIIPVDKYFEMQIFSEEKDDSMFDTYIEPLSFEEFADMYGAEGKSYLSPHTEVYLLNKKYPEQIKVIYECPHHGKKQKHHPDYDKPFEIELLCFACHHIRHKEKRILFNKW
jgi:hypothetical protein